MFKYTISYFDYFALINVTMHFISQGQKLNVAITIKLMLLIIKTKKGQ